MFSSLLWTIPFLTLFLIPVAAFASASTTRSKKSAAERVRLESYPAMENREGIYPNAASEPGRPPRLALRVQTLGIPATTAKFEEVPIEKRPQVLRRMRLCQALFEATGRAYDYRRMSTAELEAELAHHAGHRIDSSNETATTARSNSAAFEHPANPQE